MVRSVLTNGTLQSHSVIERNRRTAKSFFLLIFLSIFVHPCAAQQQAADRERYYQAIKYCRQTALLNLATTKRGPMTLSPDKRIMCFDGQVVQDARISLINDLAEGGLFVVRSRGGHTGTAIAIAELVRDRHATVVVYDLCASACAEFFLIASEQTFVVKGALVIWHNPRSGDPDHPLCSFLSTSNDGHSKKVRRGPCRAGGDGFLAYSPLLSQFFKDRTIEASFDTPPDSLYVRQRVAGLYAETGVDREIAWTLNPRYYSRLFKTKIFYEAYPESQEEVDELASRLGFGALRVIYDP